MHGHVPCSFGIGSSIRKIWNLFLPLTSKRKGRNHLPFLFRPQETEEICYYSVQPLASARPHRHTRGFTRMIAPVPAVKQYLVHEVCNFPRKCPSIAVILAGSSSADLPDSISGLSCTGKSPLLVRSKFRRVILC